MIPTLFDSIDVAEQHADTQWLAQADAIVFRFAAGARPFTTDDVWAELTRTGVTTHEPRALGAVLRRFSKVGTIVPIGYRPSTRPECHGRPVRVWVSATTVTDVR